jgi:predicted unusual protein kinase regulating ubiquinone biosynthesis (AarF/ABC1/UbiB family)
VPEGDARKEAARQLLESYYRQVMTDGFFHADPHPGNLMWWNDKIYFLDLGMVGTVGEDLREKMMLMLLALWQEDADFLAQVMLMLSQEESRSGLDMPAFRSELAELIGKYRSLSLAELQLGPLLQELTEISVRHHIRLPAELAMTGKAFGQMQLATAELDPTLDPMSVAASFFRRNMGERLRGFGSPQRLFYDLQKGRLRLERLLESIESVAGARPGPKLQVDFRGTEDVEQAIRHAGRRAGLALGGGAGLVSSAVVISGSHPIAWVAWGFGGGGTLLIAALVRDLARRRG